MKQQEKTLQSLPLWLKQPTLKHFPALDKDLTTEICIVGAGISGLTCAYLLLNAGFKIVIIDKNKIFHGDTCKTSAHLSNALDDRYVDIIKVHGKHNAKLAAESHADAITLIEEIIKQEKIDCDFLRVQGYLFSNDKEDKEIIQEYEATKELGMATHLATLPEAIVAENKKALVFKNQAQFHPIKYLSRIATIIQEKGGLIFESTQAESIDTKSNIVKLTNGKTITAKYVIQTSNMPVQCSVFINTKIESNRTYILGLAIPKNTLPMGLYWDNDDPYHYVRIQPNDGSVENMASSDDILIVGGEDHRVGLTPNEDPYAQLEKWIRAKVPAVKDVLLKWSGQILEPIDYLAYIGQTLGGGENNFMITGDSGNGLTHGTLGAKMITDLITTKVNKWTEVYNPSRKRLSSITDFIGNVAKSSVGYAGYFTTGDVKNVKDIPPGEGDIIRKGISKIAAYRDDNGKLYEFSAVCPHLKAIIRWNPLEKTWDCPAHGSRFAATGELINGPATCDLTCLRKPQK